MAQLARSSVGVADTKARTTKRLTAKAAPGLVSEVGIPGTTNWRGDPLAESNSKLLHQLAYGMPGQRTWGEWEKIARTDPDVSAVLDFIVAPLRDARVDVEAAQHEDIDPATAEAQAKFLEWCLLQSASPRWTTIVEQMVRGSLTYGHAIHETVLGPVAHPTLPAGEGIGLLRLAQRLPSSIHASNGWVEETLPDGRRELAYVRQVGQQGDKWNSDIRIPSTSLLLTTWNREGNNYRGYSAFRAVWYIAKIREQLLKLVGISLVREGAGIPAAVSQGADGTLLTPKQRKALSKLLANLVVHENASVVMPNGWDIKWIYSPGANKGHVVEAYNQLGALILRQLGAQQMALGTGGTGSRAVGEVHNQVAQSYVDGIRANLEGVLNGTGAPYTGLARRLIELNWGPQPAYPTIKLTLRKPQLSGLEKMQAIQAAVAAGTLTVTIDDENAVREELGLSPIDAEARTAAKVTALPPPGPAPTQPPGAEPQKAAASRRARLSAAPTGAIASRPLRPTEARLDLARMSSFLNTARERFERDVRPVVVEMLAKAAPDIHEAMADGDPSEVAGLKLDTSRLAEAVGRFIDACRAEGASQVKAELSKGSGPGIADKRANGDQSLAPVRFGAEEEDDKGAEESSDDTDTILDAQKDALTRRMAARLKAEVESEAIDAARTGGDSSEVVQRTLARQLDTGAFRADAGSVLTKAWNMGRDSAARELGGVKAVELSAILDGRQCTECEGLDGTQYPFDSDEHDAHVPPLRDCDGGPNCRCLLVYLTADDVGDDEEGDE